MCVGADHDIDALPPVHALDNAGGRAETNLAPAPVVIAMERRKSKQGALPRSCRI